MTLEKYTGYECIWPGQPAAFSRIRKEEDGQTDGSESRFAQSVSRLEEQFQSREEARAAYRELAETEKQIVQDAMYGSNQITVSDLRELGLVYKQISFYG